jgi:RNA polymerase sigma-70 factor (ECF subfamily)
LGTAENEFLTRMFDEMYSFLLNLAQVRMHDEQGAHDAVQETFLAAVNNIDKLMRSENPRGWLVNALKYKVMHEMRAKTRFIMLCQEMAMASNRAPPADIYDAYGQNLAETLAKEEYEVLRLVYIDGYKAREAAALLGITHDACKKRIQTAKRKLAQEISP